MSLILRQNQSNTVVTTFTENTTITGTTFYLWDVSNDDTNSSVQFIANDVSTNEFRYNQFLLTLTGSTDINLTGGTISLEPNGSWKYDVYQQNSNTNLDITLAGSIVEKGRILVSGATLPTLINYSGGSPNNIVYESE